MKDRLNYQLISNDLYTFCHLPMAKYHLIIDHKFVKALYLKHINYKKYFNVQYLDVKYVLKVDSHYECFGEQYYSIISEIISKSPLLHTIKYELQYKRFTSKIISISHDSSSSYAHTGHILEWMDLIRNNKNAAQNIFNSVRKLIYIPSQVSLYNHTDFSSVQYASFCKMLPNIFSFSLPKPRVYSNNFSLSHNHFEWQIFKCIDYYNQLQHIKCDMRLKHHTRVHYWGAKAHIDIEYHPLSYFYHFKNLKSLQLKLPLFPKCNYYYSIALNNAKKLKNKLSCPQLTNISLEFDVSSVHLFNGSVNAIAIGEYKDVIDKICAFILSYAPNIRKYKLITNDQFDKTFNHLIGYYDRLESLYIDCMSVLKNVRMISLKKLTVQLYSKNQNLIYLKLKLNNLNGYPNLETFKCVYVNKSNKKWNSLYINILNFIDYISEQKENKYLKYIGIYHKIPNKKPRNVKKEWKRINYFDLRQISKESSLELCKLIIALTTSNDNNFNLKSIELNPIALKEKELKYLYFWYSSGNGAFDTNNCLKRSDTVLTDLYCSQ